MTRRRFAISLKLMRMKNSSLRNATWWQNPHLNGRWNRAGDTGEGALGPPECRSWPSLTYPLEAAGQRFWNPVSLQSLPRTLMSLSWALWAKKNHPGESHVSAGARPRGWHQVMVGVAPLLQVDFCGDGGIVLFCTPSWVAVNRTWLRSIWSVLHQWNNSCKFI